MTDEQAFLDALKANPADDTTRLVYADWLDERGETAKAEYLRLVCEWVADGPDSPAEQRLAAFAAGLPEPWLAEAGGRFELLLNKAPTLVGQAAVNVLQLDFRLGLGSADVVSRHLPAVVLSRAPMHVIRATCRRLSSSPVSLTAQPVGCAPITLRYAFDAYTRLSCWSGTASDRDRLAMMLGAALGLSLRNVRERSLGDRVSLGRGLDINAVAELEARIRGTTFFPASHVSLDLEPVRLPARLDS